MRISTVARLSALLIAVGCAHNPPPEFVPDSSLVAAIRSIRIIPPAGACPGATIHTEYEAVLADSSRLPFARSYDKAHPPRLHVAFLDLVSSDATAKSDGDWAAARDPMATLTTGFRLTARLRAKPSVTGAVVVPPDYDCLSRHFRFSGSSGVCCGLNGNDGPDVTVRLALLHSPFHEKLYVASIEVTGARPVYILRDASGGSPADWLVVETRGGSGGNGLDGSNGIDGSPGAPGCPGQPGGTGSNGSDGNRGGDGGNGGRVTVIVPVDQPDLARLVDGRSWGGTGGSGGNGGRGGRGGSGGIGLFDSNNQPCSSGTDGAPGRDGMKGLDGIPRSSGRTSVVTTASPMIMPSQTRP